MADAEKFWDRMAERYAKSPIRDEETYNKKLEITRGYFTPESEVFEFGCGTGTTALKHASYVKHIIATDISSNMIEIARGKVSEAGVENVSFEQGTIEEFNGAEASYDVVMGHNILHLLRDPQAATQKVYKLLKPGGVFISSTACLGNGIFWRIAIAVMRLVGYAPYVSIFKREELMEYFKKAGFEIDYEMERKKGQAAFIIAKKPD